MTRNALIAAIAAHVVTLFPEDRDLTTDERAGVGAAVHMAAMKLVDWPTGTTAPRVCLDIATEYVGPLWGDEGVAQEREAWIETFDHMDAETTHYVEMDEAERRLEEMLASGNVKCPCGWKGRPVRDGETGRPACRNCRGTEGLSIDNVIA